MKRQIGRALVLLALCAGGCRKKTQPADDLSNPRAAAATFLRCLEHNDPSGAKSAAIYGGMESDMIDSMAVLASGIDKLSAAADARFGPDAMHKIDPQAVVYLSTHVADADLSGDENHAIVTPKGTKNSIPLKRVDGIWKVDIGALTHGQDLTSSVPLLAAAGKLATEAAAGIEAGKFKNTDEVRDAITLNARHVLSGETSQPSRPQDAPTTTPANR